jgi:hypothetical protein
MWPVIRRTSVPPTEMSKDHRPPRTLPPAVVHAPHAAGGSGHTRAATAPTGHNYIARTHPALHRVECRAGGIVVA